MSNAAQKRAIENYRARLTQRGFKRFEVLALESDRDLIRSLARQLAEEVPKAEQARQTVRALVSGEPSKSSGILSALRRLFRPHGYRILIDESGALGLAELEKTPVNLVISDMRMPEMDGASFLKEVRQRWPETIRILLTGYADVGSTVAAINEGEIYRYISKPWDDNEIVAIA